MLRPLNPFRGSATSAVSQDLRACNVRFDGGWCPKAREIWIMADMIATALSDLKEKGVRLAIGSLIATTVLELMMKIGAPNVLGIEPMSSAGLITNILGLTQGHPLGTIVHFGLALIAFPIGYILIAYRNFPGPLFDPRCALGRAALAWSDGCDCAASRHADIFRLPASR